VGQASAEEEDQSVEFMLILSEDPELVATEEQRAEAVQRVGEYAMNLVGDGTLKLAHPGSPPRSVGRPAS
jgi:hypothetical protein